MNWMKTLAGTLALAALCLAPVAVVAGDDPKPTMAPLPGFSADNPYAKELPAAKQAQSDALAKLNGVIQNDPFNFDAQIEAYYTYAAAQARYDTLLQLAQDWEKQNKGTLSGKVLSLDMDAILPRDAEPASAAAEPATTGDAAERHIAPEALRRASPVAGAKITLRPNRMWILNDRKRPTAGGAARPQIFPPPPGIFKVYTATSEKDGSFKFDAKTPPDSYAMTVARDGFETWHGTVEIPRTGAVERTVYLSKFKILVGIVQTIPVLARQGIDDARATATATGSAGAEGIAANPAYKLTPVAGAAVVLTPEPFILRRPEEPPQPATETANVSNLSIRPVPVPTYATKSNEKGFYSLKGLRSGRYHLRVAKDGLRPFEATLFVKGIWQHQNVVLLPVLPVPGPQPVPVMKPVRIEKSIDAPTGTTLDKPFGN